MVAKSPFIIQYFTLLFHSSFQQFFGSYIRTVDVNGEVVWPVEFHGGGGVYINSNPVSDVRRGYTHVSDVVKHTHSVIKNK